MSPGALISVVTAGLSSNGGSPLSSLNHAGGYLGCGHGHKGHPGRPHWSCCGKFTEKSECTWAGGQSAARSLLRTVALWRLPGSVVTAAASTASDHQRNPDLNAEETDRIKNKVPYVIPWSPSPFLWVTHWLYMQVVEHQRPHYVSLLLGQRSLGGGEAVSCLVKVNTRWCPSLVSF